MPWTTPRTWATSETVTAALLNTHLRDNLNAIGTWTSYTSSWTGAGGNPSLGNGTKTSFYIQAGTTVAFYINLTMGGTTTYGSGVWSLSLPVAAADTMVFPCWAADAGVQYYSGVAHTATSTTLDIILGDHDTAPAQVTPTSPFTWGSGDLISISGIYRST